MAVSLYEHQKQAVEKLRPGSVLCGGVGTGKSRTALAYFYRKICKGEFPRNGKPGSEMLEPTPLYIITTARKRDTLEWEEECVPFCMSSEPGMGPVDIHIDSWNNIKKYVDVQDAFFIFDEQRLVGTGAWTKAFWKIARMNGWILLTATPGDVWLDYAPVFIANGFFKNRTEFYRRHVVFNRFTKYPKVDRYTDTYILETYRKQILVPLEQEKKATRHHSWIKVAYDKDIYDKVAVDRWNIFENQPVINASEYCQILRKIVNSDEHRIEAVANILDSHKRAIIFYSFDYELILLRELLDGMDRVYSEWNGHKHQPLPEGQSWVYLVNYMAGAEGWNCITANTIIFYSQHYSWKVTEQSCGRIDRVNTPYRDLYYFHLFSDSGIDHAIRRCVKKKAIFNERSFSSL